MKRYIRSAEVDEEVEVSLEEKLSTMLNLLKDNFNYASDGIEKIAADGDIKGALELATTLNQMIDGAIGEIAEDIAE